jgi:3-deoxy-D-manno-octulosonic-acid transferase
LILIYHLFLIIYKAGISLVSIWNPKAKLWIQGRKNVFEKLQNLTDIFEKKSLPVIWMHAASLGEFEQGRPVLQKIRNEFTDVNIVITFFSPSGFEIAKKNKEFKNIFYLPMDSKINAKKWLNILKPDLVLWVKYEYWYFYLQEIKSRNIPLLMISGVYRSNQIFFRWYGTFYKKMLSSFTYFFLQNKNSKEQLEKIIPAKKITVAGDTRCDRVIDIAENFIEIPGIREFCNESKVIVMGSTWEEDETEWIHFARQHPEIKFIIAPHEIDAENIADVKKEFEGSVFYSEWVSEVSAINDEALGREFHCLIIDNIGMLSRLYYYATITYVGGGFGDDGLHNILEAAVYGKPVIFGPEHEKNFEAQELINCGGAISIENAIELEKMINQLLKNETELSSRSVAAKKYVYKNAGASDKVISFIKANKLI